MKVHILFRLKDEPTGGGNQFLKSLKEYLQSVRAQQIIWLEKVVQHEN